MWCLISWLEDTEAKESKGRPSSQSWTANRWIIMTFFRTVPQNVYTSRHLSALKCECYACESSVAVCKHASLSKYCMHCACVCVALSPTWSGLHILAEGLQLRFPDCRILVEDYRAAQPLCRSAQPLCSQLLSVILSNAEKMCIQLGQVLLTIDAICHRNITECIQQLTKKLRQQSFWCCSNS